MLLVQIPKRLLEEARISIEREPRKAFDAKFWILKGDTEHPASDENAWLALNEGESLYFPSLFTHRTGRK